MQGPICRNILFHSLDGRGKIESTASMLLRICLYTDKTI